MSRFFQIGQFELIVAVLLIMVSCSKGSDSIISPNDSQTEEVLDTKADLHFRLEGVEFDPTRSDASVWYEIGHNAQTDRITYNSVAKCWSMKKFMATANQMAVVWPARDVRDESVLWETIKQEDVLVGRQTGGLKDGAFVNMYHVVPLVRFSFRNAGYSGSGKISQVKVEQLNDGLLYNLSSGDVTISRNDVTLDLGGFDMDGDGSKGAFCMPAGEWEDNGGKPWIFFQGTNPDNYRLGEVFETGNGHYIAVIDRIPTIQFQIDGYWFLCRLEGKYRANAVYDVKLKVSDGKDANGHKVPTVTLAEEVSGKNWDWFGMYE